MFITDMKVYFEPFHSISGKAVNKIEVNDILFGDEIPIFNYLDGNKQRLYFPDIFIRSLNLIIDQVIFIVYL